MAASILVAILRAQTSQFDEAMKGSRQHLAGFRGEVGKAEIGLSAFTKSLLGVGAATYGLREVSRVVGLTMTNIHDLASQADRLKMTTEALGGLQYAAKMSGVSIQEFNSAIQMFARNMGLASMGSKESASALSALNLQYQQLKGMPIAQQFALVVDHLKGVSDATERAAIVTKLFGRGSIELVDMLDQESAGLSRLRKEFEALGGAVSRADAAKVEKVISRWGQLGQAGKSIVQDVAVVSSSALGPVADVAVGYVGATSSLLHGIVHSQEDMRKNQEEVLQRQADQVKKNQEAYQQALQDLQFEKAQKQGWVAPPDAVSQMISKVMALENPYVPMPSPWLPRNQAYERNLHGENPLLNIKQQPLELVPMIGPTISAEDAKAYWDAAKAHEQLTTSVNATVTAMQREAAAMTLVNQGLARSKEMADLIIATKGLPATERIKALTDYGNALKRLDEIKAAKDQEQLTGEINASVAAMQREAAALTLVNQGMAENKQMADLIISTKGWPAADRIKILTDYGNVLKQLNDIEDAYQRRYSVRQINNRLIDMQAEMTTRRRLALAPPMDRQLVYEQAELDRLKPSANSADLARIEEMQRALPELNRIERLSGVFDEVGAAFGEMAGSMVMDIRNISGAIQSLANDILRLVIRQTISEPIANATSGYLKRLYLGGGGFVGLDPAGEMHGGGVAGIDGVMRMVPAGTFAYAPRLHKGLAPDEFPAILQRGEVVLPKGGGGSAPSVVFHLHNAGQPMDVEKQDVNWEPALRQMTISAWVKEMDQNASFKNYVRSSVRGPI